MKAKIVLALTFVLVLMTSACSFEINLGPAPTPEIVVITATPQPTPIPTQTPAPTFTPIPTETPLPTLVPTPLVPAYTVTNAAGQNCRAGSSTNYPIITTLLDGQTSTILARNSDYGFLWWEIQILTNPTAICWVSSDLGYTSGNTGVVPYLYVAPIVYPTATNVPPYYPWYPPYPPFWNATVTLTNATGVSICGMNISRGYQNVYSHTWKMSSPFADGTSITVNVPAGWVNIQATGCKPKKIVASRNNVPLKPGSNSISLP